MADNYRKLSVSADQIEEAVEYICENKYTINQKLNDVQNNMHDIDELQAAMSEVYSKEETNELLNDKPNTEDVYSRSETDSLLSAKADKSNTYTKTETDSKITEKVSEIVAGAPEDFNTLKEMSDWLTEHEGSAAEMNSAIQKNKDDISAANEAIQQNVEDISNLNAGKVDKEDGKSLVSDSEIERLADVDNYDDTAVKNDIKNVKSQATINQMTIGTQCKNLLPYRCVPHSNSGGIKVAVADDGVVTLSGTNTVPFTYNINFTTPMVFDRDVFIVGAEKLSNVNYRCHVDIKVNNSNYPAIDTSGLLIPAGTSINYLYVQQPTTGKTIEATIAPMIVYADVLDRTYEPYKLSLQEQINALTARIAALEGTATTAEGGEA